MAFNLKPIREIDPLVGTSRPAHKPSKVVLPVQDGPMIERLVPCSAWNETWSRTVNFLSAEEYVLVNCSASNTISAMGVENNFTYNNRQSREIVSLKPLKW